MKRSPSPGHAPFVPPSFLTRLEEATDGAQIEGAALLAADRTTVVWSQPLPDGARAVIKLYRHRGAVSWCREKTFRFRTQREYEALAFLDSRGVPCSRPLFWSYGTDRVQGRWEILATGEIPCAVRLDACIDESNAPDHRTLVSEVFRLLRRMHEAGFHHGAMYARNILVSRAGKGSDQRPFVIDTPKSIRYPYSIIDTPMARIDLANLARTVTYRIGIDETTAALAGYCMDADSAQELVELVRRTSPGRGTRNFHRALCEFWETLALTGIRCPARKQPAPTQGRRTRKHA